MRIGGLENGVDVSAELDWHEWQLGIGVFFNARGDEYERGHAVLSVYVGPIAVGAVVYWSGS
jgi:hypothetical protein